MRLTYRTVLKSGESKPWEQVLQEAVGTNKIDASSLMEYFGPIITWLEEQNAAMNETLGWPDFNWVPPVPEGYPEDIGKPVNRFNRRRRRIFPSNKTWRIPKVNL